MPKTGCYRFRACFFGSFLHKQKRTITIIETKMWKEQHSATLAQCGLQLIKHNIKKFCSKQKASIFVLAKFLKKLHYEQS